MPIETIVVKQLSAEEESAINTAAAMTAALKSAYIGGYKPKLEALQVAFSGYPGEFKCTFDGVSIHWDGHTLLAAKAQGTMTFLPLLDADPQVQLSVARNVQYYARAFTAYLNELMTAKSASFL